MHSKLSKRPAKVLSDVPKMSPLYVSSMMAFREFLVRPPASTSNTKPRPLDDGHRATRGPADRGATALPAGQPGASPP